MIFPVIAVALAASNSGSLLNPRREGREKPQLRPYAAFCMQHCPYSSDSPSRSHTGTPALAISEASSSALIVREKGFKDRSLNNHPMHWYNPGRKRTIFARRASEEH